ncbi:flagellar FliJ protein [Salmonella enterica subsp. enterica serovar Choleraesuis]|nr:flagellar FliJ protein [Salmonella enterica subsp. enterica serovar Choleraesuis]
MNNSGPLTTLKDLAQKELDQATRQLGEIRQGYRQAEDKLDELMRYQQEYSQNLSSALSDGMASIEWRNYQQFIQTLDKAIEQHRQLLAQWQRRVDIAQGQWQDKRQRLHAWQTLQARQQTIARIAENRRDQKQMDDFSQRITRRSEE